MPMPLIKKASTSAPVPYVPSDQHDIKVLEHVSNSAFGLQADDQAAPSGMGDWSSFVDIPDAARGVCEPGGS